MNPTPTTGRIVHYYMNDDMCVSPATVLATHADINPNVWPREVPAPRVGTDEVSLLVHGLIRDYRKHAVPFSEYPKAGHWSWPPRA